MNFGELLGICFVIGGAIYGLSLLVDEKYPFIGGGISAAFMIAGLSIYYSSLKGHERSIAALFHALGLSI